MTLKESTSTYSRDELRELISFVEQIPAVGEDGGFSACSVGEWMPCFASMDTLTVFLGQLMKIFGECTPLHGCRLEFTIIIAQNRFINFHGQKLAHLNTNQSVFSGKNGNQMWFFTCISACLLFTPGLHLRDTVPFPKLMLGIDSDTSNSSGYCVCRFCST
jgi:hypothetical protein